MLRQLLVTLTIVATVAVGAFLATWRYSQPADPRAQAAAPGICLQRVVRSIGVDAHDRLIVKAHAEASRRSPTQGVAAIRQDSERQARFLAIDETMDELESRWLDDGRPVVDALDDARLRQIVVGRMRILFTTYWDDGAVEILAGLPLSAIDDAVAPARLVR